MMTMQTKDLWIEVEVTKAWWDKQGELAETYTERAYEAKGPRGTQVMVLRFGPFRLPRHEERRRDKLLEMSALMDFLVGGHIISKKITSKPF